MKCLWLWAVGLVLLFTHCGPIDWRAYATETASACAPALVRGAVGAVEGQLLSEMDRALAGGRTFDPGEWKATMAGMAARVGFAALGCAAGHLLGDLDLSRIAGPPQKARCCAHRSVRPEHQPLLLAVFARDVARAGR